MIYRFKSRLATQNRIKAFLDDAIPQSMYGPYEENYEDKFTIDYHSLPLRYTVFRAPIIDQSKFRLNLVYSQGAKPCDLPDLWGLMGYIVCSERFKEIVELVDPGFHQFIPLDILDVSDNKVTDSSFYCFFPRRFVRVEVDGDCETPGINVYLPLTETALNSGEYGLRFMRVPLEEDFLDRVVDEPSLRKNLEEFPLWQHYRVEGMMGRLTQIKMVLYFNEKMFLKLKHSELTGLKLFSKNFGCGEESIIGI